ncbi:MAG: phage tail protein [Ilumatobacteraceae bacterium]
MSTDFTAAQGGYFAFELDKVTLGFFTSCSGLSSEVDVIEQTQMTSTGKKVTVKQPGPSRTYSEVVLKRGFTKDRAINDWFDKTVDAADAVERQTGSIVILTREFEEIARFNLDRCFPSKMSVSDLNAGSGEAMVEELTIRHDELTWA